MQDGIDTDMSRISLVGVGPDEEAEFTKLKIGRPTPSRWIKSAP